MTTSFKMLDVTVEGSTEGEIEDAILALSRSACDVSNSTENVTIYISDAKIDTTKDAPLHCILVGNPSDGFRVIGPFACMKDARKYIDSEPYRENMWIAEMDMPAI
jgi:hypothetical protein